MSTHDRQYYEQTDSTFYEEYNDTRYWAIGINKMVVATPGFHIDASQMAVVSGQPEGKIRQGLMIDKMRMPGHSESNVTMLADVIYKFAENLLEDNSAFEKFKYEKMQKIFFGTESNADRSRPELEPAIQMAISKLQEDAQNPSKSPNKIRFIVDALRHAQIIAITYACVGGVNALDSARDYMTSKILQAQNTSALVITVDTAFYDSSKAPGAELTQGASATLSWITKNPKLAEIVSSIGSGSYHISLSDFTKFGSETPEVHGQLSEVTYMYVIAKALESMVNNNPGLCIEYDLVLTHVPFPKQAVKFAQFLYAHKLRTQNPEELVRLEEQIGPDPLRGHGGFTYYISNFLKARNESGEQSLSEQDIVKELEKDALLNKYVEWLKALSKTEEFNQFTSKLHFSEVFENPSKIGNSYTSSIFTGLASILGNIDKISQDVGHLPRVLFIGYGSGAQAVSMMLDVHSDKQEVSKNLHVKLNDENPVSAQVYKDLHQLHITGDAHRTLTDDNLVERDMRIKRLVDGVEVPIKLPDGFHVIKRNSDGTGEYAFVKDGKSNPVKTRF